MKTRSTFIAPQADEFEAEDRMWNANLLWLMGCELAEKI